MLRIHGRLLRQLRGFLRGLLVLGRVSRVVLLLRSGVLGLRRLLSVFLGRSLVDGLLLLHLLGRGSVLLLWTVWICFQLSEFGHRDSEDWGLLSRAGSQWKG